MFQCPGFAGLYGDDSASDGASADDSRPARRSPSRRTAKPDKPANGARWLSIDAACQMLGVDQSTLRRWSDNGKIPVFRTPGGHRRYAEEDLKALVKGEPRQRRRVSRQALTTLSRSAYQRASRDEALNQPWRSAYDPATLEEMRPLGRRLVDLAVRYVSGRSDHDEILDEAREIGARYGAFSARVGITTAEALEAFLYFRTPVIRAVTQHIEDEQVPARRAARAISDLTVFMDEVLLATILSHDDGGQGPASNRAYA